jgi:hypothetical protein
MKAFFCARAAHSGERCAGPNTEPATAYATAVLDTDSAFFALSGQQ